MRLLKAVLMVFAMTAMFATVAKGESVITTGSKVAMDYTLSVDGEVIDSSEEFGPLEYVQGDGMIIPGLEKELVGLKAGDSKDVSVSPAEAYGMPNPDALIEVPKDNLPPDQQPQTGMILQTQTPQGQPLQGVIAEIKEESVIIDFNHPLAGKTLEFKINIVSVQ